MINMVKQTVPVEIKNKLDLIAIGYKSAMDKGNFEDAELALIERWKLLPEPKLSWDLYSNTVPCGLMIFYRDIGKYAQSLEWLKVTYDSYGPDDPYVKLLEGTVYYEKGDFDKAFFIFDELYKIHKARIFRGVDGKYKQFYMGKRKQQ